MAAGISFLILSCLLAFIHAIAAIDCPLDVGSLNIADPESKTSYYSCFNGIATLQYCPTGTQFDDVSGSCAPVRTARGVNCNDGGFFQKPNPYDCTKFYKCTNGVPVSFDCPGGLHYNPRIHVCDWPDKAGCRG